MHGDLHDMEQLEEEQAIFYSQIVALFLAAILFGLFVATYSIGIWELLRGNQPSKMIRRNMLLLGTNTVMFGLASAVRSVFLFHEIRSSCTVFWFFSI